MATPEHETMPAGKRAKPARRGADSRRRLLTAMLGFTAVYGVIAGKLVYFGLNAGDDVTGAINTATTQLSLTRPDILDRNGEVLATDVKSASLYAEPRRIVASVGADEVADALGTVLPELRDEATRKKLNTKAGFVWVKREITAAQKQKIFNLGLPGIGFLEENRRFYPGGGMAGHILGYVDIDNNGIAGMERFIDKETGLGELQKLGMVPDRGLQPRRLSIDMRVQHVVRDEILEAKEKFRANFAVGIVLDVHTGEVLAMSSVPDFDPNNPGNAFEDKSTMNRATAAVYEMGSVFKTFNSAMALDSGRVQLTDMFETSGGLSIGRQHIGEFHGKGRALNVSEIFIYSSNTGSARMALKAGPETQKAYFERFGFHSKLQAELPELASPLYPRRLSEIGTATMSFGHGISVTPMHVAAAAAALMNGGVYIPPTFLPRTRDEAAKLGTRVVSPLTSAKMRFLFRLNVEAGQGGSGSRAEAPGFRVGGKTGTAEKTEGKSYAKNKNLNSFLAAFPMDDPQYVVLVVIDEPKKDGSEASALAGLTAAPPVGNIIRRIAPMLGVVPRFDIPPVTQAMAASIR